MTITKDWLYPSVPWNRCVSPSYARRKEDKPRIAQAMRGHFRCPVSRGCRGAKGKVVKKFEKIAPEFSWLEDNLDEGLSGEELVAKDPNHQRTGETAPGDPETNPGGGNPPRSIGAAAHLGCAPRGVAAGNT